MRTLLLGASFSAVPIFNRLIRAGQDVTVVGSLRDDPCHQLTNKSVFADYSDINEIRKIWLEGDFEHIVPSCNDASLKTATEIASEHNVIGYDSIETFNQIANKDEFRKLCQKLGLHAPRTIAELDRNATQEEMKILGKVLVKPIDSFSGIGISSAENEVNYLQIQRALTASKSGKVVIEEFVDGTLHSHSAFLKDGQIAWQDFVDEYCEVTPYQVSRSQYPSVLNEKIRNSVANDIAALAMHLSLSDGLIHTQFIANGDDFWLIESMRRCPGDLFGSHFSISKDFDYAWNYIAPYIGRDFDFSANQVSKSVSRQVMSHTDPIYVYGSKINSNDAETWFIPLHRSGEHVDAAPLGKAGIIFQATNSAPSDANYTIIESNTF